MNNSINELKSYFAIVSGMSGSEIWFRNKKYYENIIISKKEVSQNEINKACTELQSLICKFKY